GKRRISGERDQEFSESGRRGFAESVARGKVGTNCGNIEVGEMKKQINSLQKLLNFLDELEKQKIYFFLERNRSEAIMVRVDVPGQRWEIEFFADGEIEVEIFRSTKDGVIGGSEAQEALKHLLADFK